MTNNQQKRAAKKAAPEYNKVDAACKLIAGAGILMFTLEIVSLMRNISGFYTVFLPPVAAGYIFGFLFQGFVLRRHGWRMKVDRSWDGGTRYFVFRYSLPTLAALGLAVIPVALLLPWSPVMFIAAGCVGMYAMFYPYDRLYSMRQFFVYFSASMVICVLSLVFQAGGMATICFCVQAACGVVILNQTCVTRSFDGAAVTKINDRARLANMRMILAGLFLTLIAGVLAYMFLSGMYTLLKYIFFTVLLSILRGSSSSTRHNFAGTDGEGEYQNLLRQTSTGDAINMVFAVAMILLIILFEVATGNTAVKRFFEVIKGLIDAVLSFFLGGERYAPPPEISYADTVVSTMTAASRRRERAEVIPERLTVREYELNLRMMKSDEEKLNYSYRVMTNLIRGMIPELKPSDTPRELERKIRERMELPALSEITPVIENINYAKSSGDPEMIKAALSDAKAIIVKRL